MTRPQLEIYNDDVECSHGATVGQLDENALFYLKSRGLSHERVYVDHGLCIPNSRLYFITLPSRPL